MKKKTASCVSAKWLQEIIIFAINTGLRQSEILDLKWSQVDMNPTEPLLFLNRKMVVSIPCRLMKHHGSAEGEK
jgi:integrase